MSYTQLNYPATFASEGNPNAGDGFPGEYDPYVHGINDTMWVNDETGYFSVDVSSLPSPLASSAFCLSRWIYAYCLFCTLAYG